MPHPADWLDVLLLQQADRDAHRASVHSVTLQRLEQSIHKSQQRVYCSEPGSRQRLSVRLQTAEV